MLQESHSTNAPTMAAFLALLMQNISKILLWCSMIFFTVPGAAWLIKKPVCVYVYKINHRCSGVHSDMEMILWCKFIPDHWHKWVYWHLVKGDFIPAAYLIMPVCVRVCVWGGGAYSCVGSELGSLTPEKSLYLHSAETLLWDRGWQNWQ